MNNPLNTPDKGQGEDSKKTVEIPEGTTLEGILISSNENPEVNGALELHKQLRTQYLIDVTEDVPPPKKAWCIVNSNDSNEIILGSLGDIGMIIGKAKSRKSFFIGIAVSSALSKAPILNKFKSYLPDEKNEVAYFDTEQSKYYVQKAVKRICEQIKEPEPRNLSTFHLRALAPRERLEFVENEIYSNEKLSFVVIDGIKDLVTSINDESEATMIASKLLKWSEEREIYILVVLHQNKSDSNARGHIGTELLNKSQTVLSVAKDENDKNISVVQADFCRDIEPEPFAFEINENGIPVIVEDYEFKKSSKEGKADVSGLDESVLYKLLKDAFTKQNELTYSELVIQVGLAYKAKFRNTIGQNKIKELITICKNNEFLLQEKQKAPYTLAKIMELSDKKISDF